MTAQEVFDTVVKNLRKQGKPSKEGWACRYRGPDNTKCAVGWLIKDEDYSPNMEGYAVDLLVQQFPELPLYLGEHVSLLRELQHIHDTYLVSSWEDGWRDLARQFNLEMPKKEENE